MPKETKKTAEIKKTTASRKPVSAKAAAAKKKQEEMLYDLADLFKVFGDSTRIRILYALMDGSLCVSDISSELEMNQSAVSHQLKILKQNKLVKNTRAGKAILYELADEHVKAILEIGQEHIEEL
ncbi:MAG: winged helix-turn-helix transcriptional regulator [Clostridiales bacterium]|nr:winged helix-turn-helix transcriptional regulator [Clostridiales bacterium]MBR5936811.1 winged helix-turn-helix transcriptional regulator [Clostridiales bacterium]